MSDQSAIIRLGHAVTNINVAHSAWYMQILIYLCTYTMYNGSPAGPSPPSPRQWANVSRSNARMSELHMHVLQAAKAITASSSASDDRGPVVSDLPEDPDSVISAIPDASIKPAKPSAKPYLQQHHAPSSVVPKQNPPHPQKITYLSDSCLSLQNRRLLSRLRHTPG